MTSKTGNGGGRARMVGINHVALEVGDIDEALAFYGEIFELTLRGRSDRAAFIDMGDQFLNFQKVDDEHRDGERHFGLVVDDREAVRRRLDALGIERLGNRLNFLDPWGNRIEIVQYGDVQFSKTPEVLAGMALGDLEKSASARAELARKGMAPA